MYLSSFLYFQLFSFCFHFLSTPSLLFFLFLPSHATHFFFTLFITFFHFQLTSSFFYFLSLFPLSHFPFLLFLLFPSPLDLLHAIILFFRIRRHNKITPPLRFRFATLSLTPLPRVRYSIQTYPHLYFDSSLLCPMRFRLPYLIERQNLPFTYTFMPPHSSV